MNYYNEVNEAKDVFITKIFEPSENSLELELSIGKVSEFEEDTIISKINIGPSKRVYFDHESIRYKIYFENYICYSVINESFEQLGGEIFIGRNIRIYAESNFLNYVRADTFATNEYPGEFRHYAFLSWNHIVNVASQAEPIIERLD